MKRTILHRLGKHEKARGKNAGFSLVELVVALAIFALLLAIAIPNFESIVYGSGSNRALKEVVGILQDARLKAIKTDRPVTVDFNLPAANQIWVQWTEAGAPRELVHHLSEVPGRVTFNPLPPGGAVPPDATFTFTNLGFIIPNGAIPTRNIYIIDNNNGRQFHIAATVGGGVIERQWNGAAWTGPIMTDTSAGP